MSGAARGFIYLRTQDPKEGFKEERKEFTTLDGLVRICSTAADGEIVDRITLFSKDDAGKEVELTFSFQSMSF